MRMAKRMTLPIVDQSTCLQVRLTKSLIGLTPPRPLEQLEKERAGEQHQARKHEAVELDSRENPVPASQIHTKAARVETIFFQKKSKQASKQARKHGEQNK